MKSLGIAIDGGRFVRIDSKHALTPKNVRLRTLDGSQSTARLDFYAFRGRRRLLKKTVKVEGLSGTEGSPAELRLRAEPISGAAWEIRIRKPDGRSETIKVRTGRGGGTWILAAATAVLLGLAILFLSSRPGFRTSGAPKRGPAAARTSEGGEERTEAAESAGAPSGGSAGADEGRGDERTAENGSQGAAGPNDADGSGAAEEPDPAGKDSGENGPAASTGAAASERGGSAAAADGLSGGAAGGTAALTVLPAPAVVYFAPESAELNRRGKSILDAFARELPDGAVVEIGGHCADYGTESGRRVLSENRAEAAAAYLRERASSSVRIEARGYGVSRPATDDPLRQDLNRRVEISARRER